MPAFKGSESLLSGYRAYWIAAFIVIFAVLLYLWNPFVEPTLKTEYHSGRDSYTVVPEPSAKSVDAQPSAAMDTSIKSPQAAAIEAQLAEAQKLAEGREDRDKRIQALNELIAKVDAAEGIQRAESASDLTHPRSAPVQQELEALQERTERLQKRLN